MTYTYGADDPYELKFIPLDSAEAGFKSIRVEWRSVSESETVDLENLPVPAFPTRKTWADFQKFPKKDGKGFSDLLEWVSKDLEKIKKISDFIIEKKENNTLYGQLFSSIFDLNANSVNVSENGRNHMKNMLLTWREDKNGKQFTIYQSNIGDIFFHESNFEKFDPEAEEISFDLEKQRERDGYIARNITLGKSISERTVEHFRKSLRFPTLTIWNHGHSLSEPNVPEHFRNAVFEGIQNALMIIESDDMPDSLKEELFFFLCCLHKDAPEIVSTRLLDTVQDKKLLRRYHKNIAFAIGNAELPYQQELLENVIDPIDNEGLTKSITMVVLSIALWRSEALVFNLSETKLRKLSNDLFRCIQFDIQLLTSNIPEHRLQFHLENGLTKTEAQKKERGYQANTLCKHLELILAILRSRGIEDKKFKMILSPNQELTEKYVALVDKITKTVVKKKIELKSRISLQIEKPEMFRNTPDLLYALRMYLTGDSGANTIVITGVSDDEVS
jgi:hypothetical protein